MKKKPESPALFIHDHVKLPVPEKHLARVVEEIYHHERISRKRGVYVIFCSNAVIRKLNTEFRQINSSTDVLSFAFDEDGFLGEIYISLQKAQMQARKYKCTYEKEVTRLMVHGLYHLLGYDHEHEADRKKMEEIEAKYN